MFTDDNGIVQFEVTDNISPLHIGLNTALQSVSHTIDTHEHSEISNDSLELSLADGSATYESFAGNALFSLVSGNGGYAVLSGWSNSSQLGQVYFRTDKGVQISAGGNAATANSQSLFINESGALPVSFRARGETTLTPVPRVAAGNVPISVPSGQTQASVTVTFPAGRFTVRPIVALATHSLASTLINYSVTAVSTTSCTLNVHRTSTAETLVDWIAVQI